MYAELLETLRNNKALNDKNKVSPWLERKISDDLRKEILTATSFIKTEVTLSDRIQTMLLGIVEQPSCLTCGNPTNYFRSYRNYAKYCCQKCESSSKERLETMSRLAKEGKLSIGINAKEYQYKKYGGLMAIQADKTIVEKAKETCLERYGVDNYFKTDHAKQIVRDNREIYKKQFEESVNISKDILHQQYVIEKKIINQCAEYFGCSPVYIWNKLYEYDIPINYDWSSSSHEKELSVFLESVGVSFTCNFRQLIPPREVDVYIQDYNLAIEINGLWYHHDQRKNRGKNYHKDKLISCKEMGVDLIQFYDTEWIQKNDICKSIIMNKLGLSLKIHARKCKIKDVCETDSKKFLDENHIQGNTKSKHRLGLYYNDELICLMTLGKDRFNKGSSNIELHRFCNKTGISVIGGASKLFKYFLKTNTNKIVSYCDIRLFSGELYENLGFVLSHISSPNYYYFASNKRILENRIKYQKHKLKDILEHFDPELTEYDNMIKNNFFRIWDCGNKVYIWENEEL